MSFSLYFTQLLKTRDLSQREVARRLGHSNSGFVCKVVKGNRGIPEDKIEEWADAIGLDGESRVDFIRKANDALATKATQERLRQLEQVVMRLTIERSAFEIQLRELEEAVAKATTPR